MTPTSPSKYRLFRTSLAVFIGVFLAGAVYLAVKMRDDSPVESQTGETELDAAAKPLDPNVAALLKANELSEEKQKKIWKVEHATFELETWFGKAFRTALAERDKEALARFLRDGIRVAILTPEEGSRQTVGPLTQVEVTSSKNKLQPSDGAGLVESLLESSQSLQTIERTRMRVLALDTQDGKVWQSQLLVECVGFDDQKKRILVSSHHDVEFTFSSDDEIKSGGIISGWQDKDRRWRTGDAAFFEETTESAGLANLPMADNWKLDPKETQRSWSHVAVDDFDRDGFPDIAIGSSTQHRPLLLQSNQGRTFEDVTEEMLWITRPVEYLNLASWIDFDNDGWPDLLLGERLYHNHQGKRFDEVTSDLKFGFLPMGISVVDYDCDGLLDVYVLYQISAPTDDSESRSLEPWVGDHGNGVPNQLWRNEGGGRFRDVTEESNAGGGLRMSFATTWHFLDDDHFPDLYIANDFAQNVHLRNRGDGTFEDVSEITGTADFATTMGVCSGDINNDGQPEIYAANMFSKMGRRIIRHVGDDDYTEGVYRQIQGSCAGNRLYTPSSGSMKFVETSELAGVNQVGWAYAPAMADFNADGLLDIYATTGFMSFNRSKPDG